jgi:hypothetical protein
VNERPVPATTPPDTYPPLLGLRVWLYEYVAPLFVGFRAANASAATLRWRANNAAKPAECSCGRPGTVRVTDGMGGYVGSVAPTWRRCDDHADVPLTVPWCNGQPMNGQTREECSWKMWRNDTRLVTDCGCRSHVGEEYR